MDIRVNYQSSICIDSNIYFDPLEIEKGSAKVIFITHPHFDHFSPKDISKILAKDTIIVCPESMENEVRKYFDCTIMSVVSDKKYRVYDIEFTTIPAYNTNKKFHPRENNWVGYKLNIDNTTVVITGDCDATEELKNTKCDVLLLPIGGKYTMNVDEAADLTNIISPSLVIPTHYGSIVGNPNMGKEFASKIHPQIKVEIKL